jgi:predicted Rossmann-fold nucleotide-binding protein
LTLVQTGKMSKDDLVILLYGEKYWREILNFDSMIKHKTISPEDLRLFSFCSSPKEAFSFLKDRLIKFLE